MKRSLSNSETGQPYKKKAKTASLPEHELVTETLEKKETSLLTQANDIIDPVDDNTNQSVTANSHALEQGTMHHDDVALSHDVSQTQTESLSSPSLGASSAQVNRAALFHDNSESQNISTLCAAQQEHRYVWGSIPTDPSENTETSLKK